MAAWYLAPSLILVLPLEPRLCLSNYNLCLNTLESTERKLRKIIWISIEFELFALHMTATPKVMPPVLLSWTTVSEADVSGMAVEVVPSCQYSYTFCCHVTDDSRGAVWQNSIWHGSAYEAKGWNWIPPCRKKWRRLTSINACWMFMENKQWCWWWSYKECWNKKMSLSEEV